ncbi:MAG TPA: hypothetical protein VHC69_09010 [Polyangiaceae bacterium]|nr:hypothetical protein [Polyangiaceae bacterium]
MRESALDASNTTTAGSNSDPFPSDPKAALIRALEEATKAGQWSVVTRLAELIAKMDATPASVVDLDAVWQGRGRKG